MACNCGIQSLPYPAESAVGSKLPSVAGTGGPVCQCPGLLLQHDWLAFSILNPWLSGFGIPHTNLYLKFTQPYLLTVRLSKVYRMTGEYSVLPIYSFLSMDILVSPSGSHLVWVGTGSIGKARAESSSNTPSSHKPC